MQCTFHPSPGRLALQPCPTLRLLGPSLQYRAVVTPRPVSAGSAATQPTDAQPQVLYPPPQLHRDDEAEDFAGNPGCDPDEEDESNESHADAFPADQLDLAPASNTRIKTAEYLSSCVDYRQCPRPKHPEFAVIGRSNVGKSSLINMLTNNKNLAHVSKEPGKTRCINHFLINDSWYLVDLPGYGYARTGFSTRGMFDKFTKDYFLKRPNLVMVYLLVDASIQPQAVDLEYAAWLRAMGVRFTLVFTKADKRKKGEPPLHVNVQAFQHCLLTQHASAFPKLPPCVVTSAVDKLGKTRLLHLTASLRDKCVASGRLGSMMLAWQQQRYGVGSTEETHSGDSTANDDSLPTLSTRSGNKVLLSRVPTSPQNSPLPSPTARKAGVKSYKSDSSKDSQPQDQRKEKVYVASPALKRRLARSVVVVKPERFGAPVIVNSDIGSSK
ncbi:P-loop containing nucleoside triphosphate hydrolase protein [Haematococcus lacustris]